MKIIHTLLIFVFVLINLTQTNANNNGRNNNNYNNNNNNRDNRDNCDLDRLNYNNHYHDNHHHNNSNNKNVYRIQFGNWIKENDKKYSSFEFLKRFKNFKNNLEFIEKTNKRTSNSTGIVLGLNEYSDLSAKEFKNYFSSNFGPTPTTNLSGFNISVNNSTTKSPTNNLLKASTTPASIDYRSGITPVKNVGIGCGSDYALATIDVIEYSYNLNSANLVPLSSQQLLDCDTNSSGCKGGHPVYSLMYLQNYGIQTDKDYKYEAKPGKCRYNSSLVVYNIKKPVGGQLDGDENALKSIIATYGPMIVAIDTPNEFSFYKDGIFSSTKCSSKLSDADHVMAIVGYGTDKKLGDYWLVKNNWGTSWGNKGYMKIKRGTNECGIANEVYGLAPI